MFWIIYVVTVGPNPYTFEVEGRGESPEAARKDAEHNVSKGLRERREVDPQACIRAITCRVSNYEVTQPIEVRKLGHKPSRALWGGPTRRVWRALWRFLVGPAPHRQSAL